MLWHGATTPDVFTGADGPYATDQLEYLDWVREGGTHVLIANQFTIGPAPAIYLQPMFVISGVIWRIGTSLGFALQVWRPVAVGVLLVGTVSYVRRLLPSAGARGAATMLALFYSVPVAAIVNWAHWGTASSQLDFRIVAGELFEASRLWGYLPSIIAAGLMPLFLLGVERILDDEGPAPARAIALTAIAGGLTAWFHPWQGEALILMTALLCAWRRFDRRCLRLVAPLAATAMIIVYYLALRHFNASWRIAGGSQLQPAIPLGVLAASLAPLLLPALGGLRAAADTQERLLLLWPPTVLIAYFAGGQASQLHLLEGISLPLAILAVRGAGRLRRPAVAAALGLAALTVPGMLFIANQERANVHKQIEATYLKAGEAAALGYLAHDPTPGGVISTRYLAPAVPAFADRQVWNGHPAWTPGYARRTRLATAIFKGRLTGLRARRVIAASGARFLLADCHTRTNLAQAVGAGMLRAPRWFGCAAVYRVTGPAVAARSESS